MVLIYFVEDAKEFSKDEFSENKSYCSNLDIFYVNTD